MGSQTSKSSDSGASRREAASLWVFVSLMALVFLALGVPELPSQSLQGVLWIGLGLLMTLLPPVVGMPRAWILLAGGFVVMAAAGFLPRAWASIPFWRTDLEAIGLDTGPCLWVQPWLVAEHWAGFALTAVAALYLLGHRVGTKAHLRLLLCFAWGVAVWAALALLVLEPGEDFGFFPNRNHSATLLAMGAFAGLGTLVQAIRFRERWIMALAVPPLGMSLVTIFAVSESRAGMLLVVAGFCAWVALAGKRNLRGNVGRAVILLALGFLGLFLTVDSRVKTRLGETFTAATQQGGTARSTAELAADGRIGIVKDALVMSAREPWTGVGPGNFEVVFPQYRHFTNAPNESRCLHPESDWLQMVVETGWPATLCLLAGTGAVISMAIRRAARHPATRPLKMGSLVAGLLVCLHGFFDVPGHRMGLAWGAILLVALTLRPHRPEERHSDPLASSASRLVWRLAGGLVLAAGAVLLLAQWRGEAMLPSAKVAALVDQAREFQEADQAAYKEAETGDSAYQPPADADPLEHALARVARAQKINPLNPHLHHVRGVLALYFDDKRDLARHAFACERRLLPTRVSVPMKQARAWKGQDPDEILVLWRETLRRAAADEARFQGTAFKVAATFSRLILDAGKDESLGMLALQLAGTDPVLLPEWAKSARVSLLNRELPAAIPKAPSADTRRQLVEIWRKRGDRAAVKAFTDSHPDLTLTEKTTDAPPQE